MKCKYCGKDLMDGAKFCVYCGKPIEEDIPTEEKEVQPENSIPPMQPVNTTESVVKEKIEEIKTNTVQNIEQPKVEPTPLKPIEEEKVEQTIVDIVAPVKEEIQPEPTPIELPKEQTETPKQEINVETKIVKKNNPILIVIIFVLLAIIIGGGIFVYTKYIAPSDSKKSSNQQPETTNEVTEKEDEEIKELDLSKSLNTENVNYSNATDVSSDYGLSMEINSDKKSVTLKVDWNKFGPLSTVSAISTDSKDYQITGFKRDVVGTFVGDLGQDAMGITLFYLMSDGTVEYTPVFVKKQDTQGNMYYDINYTYEKTSDGKITNSYFETNGTISNVSGVIKLYNADAYNMTGGKTVLGALKDGSFYDLGYVINN